MSTFDPTPARRRAHPFNAVAGLAFLAVAAVWTAREQDLLEGYEIGRIVAVALIVLGALGVVATLLVSRRPAAVDRPGRDTAHGTTPDEEDDDELEAPAPQP